MLTYYCCIIYRSRQAEGQKNLVLVLVLVSFSSQMPLPVLLSPTASFWLISRSQSSSPLHKYLYLRRCSGDENDVERLIRSPKKWKQRTYLFVTINSLLLIIKLIAKVELVCKSNFQICVKTNSSLYSYGY